ncbi:MAG: AAA family ATPase [Oligoflexia bacterium]|nr:AAA family ATPase [Oligoflexia bacterium]
MKLALGYSDFKKIIDQKFDFVDKSLFIKEFFDDAATEVSVITRPRRFGKTLNLSMLRYFLAAEVGGESTKGLFDNLKIANCGSDANGANYISLQGQYPVIFLTFKDVKETSFTNAIEKMRIILQALYREHQHLLNSKELAENEKNIIKKYLEGQVNQAELENSIKILSEFLCKHYQKKVFILLDEYDTPIQSSYIAGYYKEMMDLMRGMLGAALKDNLALNRAVITGVIRVAKESLFSGLNNVEIYSVMQFKYSQYFGFTEEEVGDLLEKAKMSDHTSTVKEWYNGYKFAGTIVYNPWSIVNFIQKNELRAYWVNTSDNALIRDVVIHSSSEFKTNLEELLLGKSCEQLIDEHVVFGDLKQNKGAAWSLLVSAGYLNVVSFKIVRQGLICLLTIPNQEISSVYSNMIEMWLSSDRGIQWYNNFLNNLLTGNIREFAVGLEKLLTQVSSVYDMASEPEAFYHGLMLGLTASLDHTVYELSSNREGGYGRYDIAITPKDDNKLGIILELKSISNESNRKNNSNKSNNRSIKSLTLLLEKSAKEALAQIDEKNYLVGMLQRGIKKIVKIGIAFAGKRFQIATATIPSEKAKKFATKKTKKIKASTTTQKDKIAKPATKIATKITAKIAKVTKKVTKTRKTTPSAKKSSKQQKIKR